MERFRPALKDRHGDATPAAHKVHELVRADQFLKNRADPSVEFSMSPMQKAKYEVQREILLVDLRVAQQPAARERRLEKMREALIEEDIPPWRELPDRR